MPLGVIELRGEAGGGAASSSILGVYIKNTGTTQLRQMVTGTTQLRQMVTDTPANA